MTERRGFLKSLFGGAVALPAVKTIETLRLEPNDALVLTCEGAISSETAARLRAIVQEHFPGRQCLVLSEGLELKVIKG